MHASCIIVMLVICQFSFTSHYFAVFTIIKPSNFVVPMEAVEVEIDAFDSESWDELNSEDGAWTLNHRFTIETWGFNRGKW